MKTSSGDLNVVNLFFELGTLRKIARSHRQSLLTDDMSDNIASHSFRVTSIAYFLSKMEKADTEKVILMSLFHDVSESRSGDQNWIHKKYVKVFEEEILKDQFEGIPNAKDLISILKEYNERKTLESMVAKDADRLDQILLITEYSRNGNQEALSWLKENYHLKSMQTKSGKKLGKLITKTKPSLWWNNLWTEKRR